VFGLFKPLLVFFGIEIFIFSTVPGGKTRVKKLEEIARWTLERIPATAPNTRLDMRLQELQNAAESRRYVKNTIPWQILIIKAIVLRHSGKHASRGGGEFGPFFVLAKIPFHLVPQIYSHFITLIKYFLEYT
jgi:hypothetical protein